MLEKNFSVIKRIYFNFLEIDLFIYRKKVITFNSSGQNHILKLSFIFFSVPKNFLIYIHS